MANLASVTITGPDEASLAALVRTLVEERLIACGNIVPAIRSIYVWDGTVQEDAEAFALLHTQADLVDRVITRVNDLHPYDTPQVLALPVIVANPTYAQWIDGAVSDPPSSSSQPVASD